MAARRRRLRKVQSELVTQLYEASGGDWAQVMTDERVAQWDVSRDFLATHLANRRKGQRRKARSVAESAPMIVAYRHRDVDEWLVATAGKLRWVPREAFRDAFGCECAALQVFEEERLATQ